MAGPWEKYRKPVDGPWTKYASPKAEQPRQQHPELVVPERKVGMGESAGYGASDTATFGFGDEIAAGLISLLEKLPGRSGKGYGDILAEIRGQQKSAAEQNPGSHLAGQVAGGVAQGVAVGPGILASAPSIGGRVLGGSLTGGLMGGAYGVGSGEGTLDRLQGGVTGGATGAALGAAFPLVAAGASSAIRAGRNAMAGNRAAAQAGASPEALRLLGGTMQADDTLGALGRQNMARAGQDAMLADAGPRARGILDTAIQRSGQGGVGARRAIQGRVDRASEAVTKTLDDTLGAPQGVTATRSAIRTGSAAARGGAYDDAYRASIDYADPRGQALESLVRERVPASAIRQANALMRADGHQSQQILARVADDGAVTFESLPDVRQLDYITRALNDVASSAEGTGAMGGTSQLGRSYQNLSREIRDTLRDIVPEYGTALETAADPIRRSQAVELGSKLLSASMTRDQVDEAVRGMTGPERQAAAQGIRSRVDDMMATVRRSLSDPNVDAREAAKAIKDLSSRANRTKIAAVIGNDAADRMFREVDRAATAFEMQAGVAENSKTYARQSIDRMVEQQTSPGIIGQILEGAPINAGKRAVQAVTGRTPEALARRQEGIYSEIADILTRSPDSAGGLFNAISGLARDEDANRLLGEGLLQMLSRAQQPTVYPSVGLLQNRQQR